MRREDLSPAETPVLLIPVDMIDVPADRLRSLKLAQADAIGAAIVADGQYDPITVAQLPGSERFVLVDGLHRLEGCRQHQIRLIEARIGDADREARVRQEVLSAWARADHDVFDTAAQVAAIASLSGWAVSEALGSEPTKEAEKNACAIMAQTLRWDIETAQTLGIGRRSVFRHLKILRAFDDDQVAMLRRHGLADELVPLERLSALPPRDFDRAMAALARGDMSMAEALALVAEAATASPFAKKSTAFLTFLRAKATARERADLMRQLNDEYLPDGRPRAKAD
jgi:ParB family chromosome partitioning protein